MAFTGYDPNVVRTAITNIGNSYDALIDALVTKNQTNFVQAMGSVWASEQAKEFFSAYQTDIARLVLEVNKVYDSIANAMNSAAKTLASTSGSTWSNVDIVIKEPIIDLSSIKDNINGVKGIDLVNATSTLEQLETTILSAITSALESTLSAISDSGFVGGDMESSLKSSITSIKTSIEAAFSQIKTDANTAINDTISKYSTDASNISTAFSGGQSA